MEFENQVIVIMGGSSGIGLATAELVVREGGYVIVTGRDNTKLALGKERLGNAARAEMVEASSAQDVKQLFESIGRFNHLVLCVSGGAGKGDFRALDLAELRRGFEAKFWPQILTAQASLNTIDTNGSITFITAISARTSQPGTAGLAAINGAIEAMVGALASELRPLRVNAVSPGVVDTAWWDRVPAAQKAKLFSELALAVPVGRVGKAEDIASVVAMLMQNSFITGTVIEADGGWRLK